MASKNNIANRGNILKVQCPKCGGNLYIVVHKGQGQNGRFYHCDSCEYNIKFHKGMYTQFEY
jgi:predicted RNA-binding Zn-ribbon protein involved in translation (DUF1610 family)